MPSSARRTCSDRCAAAAALAAARKPRGSRWPQLDDADWLRREYLLRGCTADEIAAELGCDPGTVRYALRRHGIPRRPSGPRRRA